MQSTIPHSRLVAPIRAAMTVREYEASQAKHNTIWRESMMSMSTPKFEWGQRVRAARNLFNDGSYPEQPASALLVRKGEAGEIVQIGCHMESGTVVYKVEFALNQIIGCLEPELMPWQSSGESQ